MKPRSQLETEVIEKCKKLAKLLSISEDEAEKRAKQLLPANSDKDLRDFLSQPLKKLTLNFLDPGHRTADKKIAQMDREVSKVYNRASEEMSQKLEKYLDRFREADERMKKNVADGLMPEDDYKTWRKGQLMQAERWTHMRDELAADASNSVDIARSVIQGHMPEVYAENFNYGAYEIEHDTRMNTSFTLYDRQTVERLLRDNPKLLPDPSKESKTALKIAKNKDLRWNRNHIQGELLQGILQGESIPDIAKRMRNVEKMNKRASMNYARTMTTGAENAGRIDSYRRAQDMGIDVGPAWMATLDGRTRDSHRHLDGERRNEKTGKFSNGCRYPGDPQGRPEEVYNCRCTLVAQIKGFESDFSDMSWRRHDQLGKMSYEEWKQDKKAQAVEKVPDVVQGKDISLTWKRRIDEFKFGIEDVINAQGFDGKPRLVNRAQFDKAVKAANGGNGFIAQRTYSAPDEETLKEYQEQLYNGKWYVSCSGGGAQYGCGMYSASNYDGKLNDYISGEMEHYSHNGHGNKSVIETFTLDPSAKIINFDDLQKKFGEFKQQVKDKGFRERTKFKGDMGAFAASLGYDGIRTSKANDKNCYTIVLNRTKCIFLKE